MVISVWFMLSDFQHFTFCQNILTSNSYYCNDAPTWGKMVRILSQLRESDLPVGDASRTLPSSSGLLEVLTLYHLLVDYIGSKVCSVSWGSLTFPSMMRAEHCAQAVTYLSYCQYIDHWSIILGVKVPWIRCLGSVWALSLQFWTHGCRFYIER